MITKLKCTKDCCIAEKGDTLYANSDALYMDENTSQFVIMKKYIKKFDEYFKIIGKPKVSPAISLPKKEFYDSDVSQFLNIGIEVQSVKLKTRPITKEFLYTALINYFYTGYFWNKFNVFNYIKIDEKEIKQIKAITGGHMIFEDGTDIAIMNTNSMRLATDDEVSNYFRSKSKT